MKRDPLHERHPDPEPPAIVRYTPEVRERRVSAVAHAMIQETHVVVGDHTPEPRREPMPRERHMSKRRALAAGYGRGAFHDMQMIPGVVVTGSIGNHEFKTGVIPHAEALDLYQFALQGQPHVPSDEPDASGVEGETPR